MKIHNFSAGPSILAQEVLQEAAQAVVNFQDTGLSLLEMSHRSKEFDAVLNEAVDLVHELLQLPEGFKTIFLSGGASTQFALVPMNLLPVGGKAAYVNTGTWADKAIKEAKAFGNIEVVADSKADNYTHIPKNYQVPSDAVYLHVTTNNTVFGTQFHKLPETRVPIVADMSSDIFSYEVDMNKVGLIYAGAQKNMGPAGTTLIVVREDLLGKADRHLPSMFDYRIHIKKNSAYNTPPVFPIYVSMLNLRWVKKNGGVKAMESRSIARSELIYSEIDRNPLFRGTTATEDRSRMNATFVLNDDYHSLDSDFLELCKNAGISGIKGHRSVGGFRASMYNAMELDSVQVLVDVMKDLESRKG
ncbi:MAG: 3-phosphoserine/phosphohydroxythreonine transaminase [Saprospirales bacterium]|nr:MAG: 3-phosphoserine/phosphohydroxythreonine transaminase [Saprospirales bacterium]